MSSVPPTTPLAGDEPQRYISLLRPWAGAGTRRYENWGPPRLPLAEDKPQRYMFIYGRSSSFFGCNVFRAAVVRGSSPRRD